jgi:hypothetical protein
MIYISNPPECLIDYIVLKEGCYCNADGTKAEVPTPKSGFYIEFLQGISIENLSDISPENQDATSLVNNMVYLAAQVTEKRLTNWLSKNGFDLNKRGKKYEACNPSTKADVPVAFDKGIRISKANIDSDQAVIFLEAIKVKAQNDGTTTLKIEDVDGNVLWSQSATLVANQEISFKVNQSFTEDIIFVLADSTNVGLYEWNCNYQGGCCGKQISLRQDLSVMGFDGVQNSFTGFLGVCARLNCTDKNIICNFLDKLEMSILYQTGAEILKEWLSPSSRINLIKSFGKDWAQEQIEVYQNQSIEYLESEIRNIQNLLSYDRYCYSCENNLRTINTIP